MTSESKPRTTVLPSGATLTDLTGAAGSTAPILKYELEGEKLTLVFQPEQGDWNNLTNRQSDIWLIQHDRQGEKKVNEYDITLEGAVKAAERMAGSALEEKRKKRDRDQQDSERRQAAIEKAAGEVEQLFQGA